MSSDEECGSPHRKMKKLGLAYSNRGNDPKSGGFAQLTGRIVHLEETVRAQNLAIMEVLAELKVSVARLVRQESAATPIAALFPVKSENDLTSVNVKIVSENRDLYLSAVRNLLRSGLAKSFNNILSKEVVLAFNVDGTHGKKRFKDYENVYNVILDAIASLPCTDPPDQQLRKAFQSVKKRHFQKVAKENETNSQI